jgi:hypothetical protein
LSLDTGANKRRILDITRILVKFYAMAGIVRAGYHRETGEPSPSIVAGYIGRLFGAVKVFKGFKKFGATCVLRCNPVARD